MNSLLILTAASLCLLLSFLIVRSYFSRRLNSSAELRKMLRVMVEELKQNKIAIDAEPADIIFQGSRLIDSGVIGSFDDLQKFVNLFVVICTADGLKLTLQGVMSELEARNLYEPARITDARIRGEKLIDSGGIRSFAELRRFLEQIRDEYADPETE